jgi:hypothetical protein
MTAMREKEAFSECSVYVVGVAPLRVEAGTEHARQIRMARAMARGM